VGDVSIIVVRSVNISHCDWSSLLRAWSVSSKANELDRIIYTYSGIYLGKSRACCRFFDMACPHQIHLRWSLEGIAIVVVIAARDASSVSDADEARFAESLAHKQMKIDHTR
jgi:hypothetical protein